MGQAASREGPTGYGGGEAQNASGAGDGQFIAPVAETSGAECSRSEYATEGRSEEEIRTAIEKSKEQGWSELKEQGCGHDKENRLVWEQLKRERPLFFVDYGERVELGRKIAEGGQAQIYEARFDGQEKFVSKVYKAEGFSLAALLRHWPRSTKIPPRHAMFTPAHDYHKYIKLGGFAFDDYLQGCCFIHCGTFLKDGRFAMVMRRCWGDLRALINLRLKHTNSQGPPFSQSTSIEIMIYIARGMKGLHEIGVLHRDLKGANILIDLSREGAVSYASVADFESSMLVQGTGFWRAPEVLKELLKEERDQSVEIWTEKVDIYSFAMTCYEVLTGGTPFPRYFKRDWQKVIDGERPHLPSYVDPRVRELVEQLWDKEPSKRPTFDILVHKLSHIWESDHMGISISYLGTPFP